MKKIIYSLGLSILLSCPAWAQEQQPQPLQNDTPAMSEEDAQTIFFSEDFLNDLTADEDEVLIFNDIPIEKENVLSPAKNIQETSSEQLMPVEDSSKTDTIISDQKRNNPVDTSKSSQTMQKISPQNSEAKEIPVIQNQPIAEKKPQNIGTISSPSVSENISKQQETKNSLPPKAISSTEKISEKTTIEMQKNQSQVSQPSVSEKELQQTSKQEPAQNTIQKESQRTSSLKESSERTSHVSDVATETPSDNLPTKPTLQEILQEKSPSPSKETSIAPSLPEKNAFSLDDTAPLPQNLLNDNSLTSNMLNRGIRISPEQRAKMMMKKKFSEMDLDRDGIISKDEFIRYKTAEAQKISLQVFQQIDSNHDDILSEYEYDILMNKMIENYIKAPQRK